MVAIQLRPKVEDEIRQIAAEQGCELLAIEQAGSGRSLTVRLVLDKEGGVTLDDCESVSRQVSPLLDAEADISVSYHLEVSSPGLDRKLYSAADAARFAGRRVHVRTREPREGSRNFHGTLAAGDGDTLRVVDDAAGKTYTFSFGEIDTARLEAGGIEPRRGKR